MTNPKDLTDCELLQAVAIGSEEALATLYRRKQGSIYRFALQMSGSHALAEDVLQEVFMVLIRGKAEYDSTRGSVNALLLGIARNHVLRRLHYQQGLVSLEDESVEKTQVTAEIDGPLSQLSRSETLESVRRTILTLPEHYREVVILCELQEMSYVEAAGILGCAVGTVRSRLHRARAVLIEKLRPVAQPEPSEADAGPERCFA